MLRERVEQAAPAAVVGGLAAWIVIHAAMRADPLLALVSVVIAGTGARVAALRWRHIYFERRRFVE